jgi:hypothetical protein
MFLILQALCAPRSASAGCNHLVDLQTGTDHFPTAIERMFVDLAAHSDPVPTPQPARPCSGVWCSGQPATPPIPPGALDDVPFETWAWCRSILRSAESATPTILRLSAAILRPLIAVSDVFHPPRFVLSDR